MITILIGGNSLKAMMQRNCIAMFSSASVNLFITSQTYPKSQTGSLRAEGMAIFALIVGSVIGLIASLISFFVFDFSFILAFLTYQIVGIVFTLSIIMLRLSDGPTPTEAKRPSGIVRT